MFEKSKKALAIMLVLVFALSLMPNIAMAESAMVTVNFINGAVTRSSSGSMTAVDTQNSTWELSYYYGSPVLTTGNSYRGFAQMDFTGYEAILNNPNTTINYNVVSGSYSSTAMRDVRAIIQPGSVDDVYDAFTMTYTIANSLGMLDTADKPVLYIENDGVDTPAGGVVNSAADIDALRTAFNEDYDDSIITLYFESLGSGDNSIRLSNTSGIQINYDDSDIDNQAYVNEIAGGLTWDKISAQAFDSVLDDVNLPSKYLGADVTWSSSDPDALNAETGVVTPVKGEEKDVTLTANLTYKGVVGEEATATATINIKVAPIPLSKVIVDNPKVVYKRWTRGGSHEENFQGVPAYGDYPVHNSPTWMANDRQTYFKVDLAGFEKYIDVARNVKFTLTGSNRQSTSGRAEVTLLSAKNDMVWNPDTITHKFTTNTGMHSDSGYFSQEFDMSQEVKFSSSELAAGLKQELQDDPTNSTITLRFNGAPGNSTEMNLHHPSLVLEIEYYEEDLSDEGFIDNIKGKLAWENVSSQDPAVIFEDIKLPSNYYGFPVTWSSSDENVITNEGKVNISDTVRYEVTLTATIDYGITSEAKEFNLVVPKKMISLENIYDGTKALGEANVVSTVEAKGVGGKALTDSYINFANTSMDYYPLSTATADGANDVLEFSALVPEGAPGMHMYIGIFGTSGQQDASRMTIPCTIQADGLYYGFSAQSYKIVDHDATKWTNYALVAPKGMTGEVDSDGNPVGDNTYEFYINGVKVFEHSAQITNGGFAYIRFYTYAESITDTSIYFDNIRVYSGDYVPEYDMLSAFETSYGVVDNKIVLKDTSLKISDVLADIKVDEDAAIRVYDENDLLVTDYTLPAVGNKLVVADRNGTNLERAYSVYEIEYTQGKDIIFGNPYLIYVNGSSKANVSVLNYTGNTVSYKVYLAIYEDGELVDLTSETLTASSGDTATVTPKLSSDANKKSKLFVWSVDDITPELNFVEYN